MSASTVHRPEVEHLRQAEIKVMQALRLLTPHRRDAEPVERYAAEQLLDEIISHVVAARLPLTASRPVRLVAEGDGQP